MTRLKIGEAMPNDAKATPVAIEPEGDWYGLYKSGSRDDHLFTAASVRHPAKCSLALCNKILDTMQEWGWIETGSLVVDPFGGRGTTALCWLARNAANRALTVELEPHFVEMQNRNKEHAERRLHRELAWVILQGDSRRFDEYYAEGKAAAILSPPYEDSLVAPQGAGGGSEGWSASYAKAQKTGDWDAFRKLVRAASTPAGSGYGNLPDSAITSAPYSQDGQPGRAGSRKREMERPAADRIGSSCWNDEGYGHSDGQIGDLPDPPAASVLSAPYGAKGVHDHDAEREARFAEARGRTKESVQQYIEGDYGSTPGQIGNLPDPPAASVLSAPYAAAENRRAAGKVQDGEVSDAITRAYDATNHGQTDGQIANLPDKDVAAVTSAPYSGDLKHDRTFAERDARAGETKDLTNACGRGSFRGSPTYGETPGQIGRLPDACVTSAPFEDSLASDDPEKRGGFLKSDPKRRNDPSLTATYGDAAAVTSQPYEATPGGGTPSPTGVLNQGVSERHMASRIGKTGGYADNQQGQIGVLQTEHYADACGKVYASLAKAGIRYVASVTKDPVKNKKLRPLRLLTISLFEQAGYRLVAWRRAHLFATEGEENERAGQGSLFGNELEESKRLVGRLSFFRRLSLAKGGIAARWEDVLFFELAAPTEQPATEKPRWVQPELPGTA
jgi:hypothetical protein